MTRVEEKYQADLSQARKSREEKLAQHQGRMVAMCVQHQHESDDMEQRQTFEVTELKRVNDEKQATQAANMVALKGKNQHKMDKLCGLMRQTEQLEAQIEADTLRYFRLAERVKHERSAMRDYANLQRMTETQLSAQMQHIRAIQEELAGKGSRLQDLSEQ